MRRRRGFADCFLFGDIFFAAFLAWIGMVVIVAPIITFTVMWAGAWVEPEVRPEPPRAALFAATCTMLVLGFVSLVFVEWFSGGARLSVEQLCTDLEFGRGRPIRRRLYWLAGAMVFGSLLFATLPFSTLPLDMHLAFAWAGACNLVLIAAVAIMAAWRRLSITLRRRVAFASRG